MARLVVCLAAAALAYGLDREEKGAKTVPVDDPETETEP